MLDDILAAVWAIAAVIALDAVLNAAFAGRVLFLGVF